MSALETDLSDRRRAERVRIDGKIPALIGRGDGQLIDLSRSGAKIRHTTLVGRGATVRVSFQCSERRFSASAEVLASRVVTIGGGDTQYESRLRFTAIDPGSDATLERALEAIATDDMRKWVANLRGWSDDAAPQLHATRASFLRCRLAGTRWEVKCTTSPTQPEDGFLLPATTPDSEVITLCSTYLGADDEARRAIRLMAAAAVEEVCSNAA